VVTQRDRVVHGSLAALAVLLLVAGCGGSSSAGSAGPSPSSVASAPPSSASGPSPASAGAANQIRQAWVTFFKGSTPAAAKILLLQHGSEVAAVINAQAGNPLATGTAAKVSSVTIKSPTRAVVNYGITIDGKPALSHQHGTAVKVGGHWLVSLDSFCGLLSLEGTHPAACPSAGSSSSP
jgi:hypothetical protein